MGKEADQTLQDYIRFNRPEHVFRQLNFMQFVSDPEFRVTGKLTRTLNDLFGDDLVPTIETIREIYLPFFDVGEEGILRKGVSWVRSHYKEFIDVGIGSRVSSLPVEVLLFYHTLHFLPTFSPQASRQGGAEYNVSVAFIPGSQSFKDDIHRLTLSFYDKVKYGLGYEEGSKRFNPTLYSTSLTMRRLTDLFWKDQDIADKLESADYLTWEMLKRYYIELKRRSYSSTGAFL